jgi:hypothetical protein
MRCELILAKHPQLENAWLPNFSRHDKHKLLGTFTQSVRKTMYSTSTNCCEQELVASTKGMGTNGATINREAFSVWD